MWPRGGSRRYHVADLKEDCLTLTAPRGRQAGSGNLSGGFRRCLARSLPGGSDMNDRKQMTALGRSIEDGSFAIIDQEAGPHDFGPAEWQVVRRVIHATADFEFKTLMRFHPDAVPAGGGAVQGGLPP